MNLGIAGAIGQLDSVQKSGNFGNLASTAPANATSSTVTLTFGASRFISLSYGPGANVLQRNINGGGFANYTVPFSMTSGQTLQIRMVAPTAVEASSVTITDDLLAQTIEVCTVSIV